MSEMKIIIWLWRCGCTTHNKCKCENLTWTEGQRGSVNVWRKEKKIKKKKEIAGVHYTKCVSA